MSVDSLAETHHPLQPGERPFHVLDTRDFSKEWLDQDLFPLAQEMEWRIW